MKVLKVLVSMVKYYKSGCRQAFDEEGYSICISWLIMRRQLKDVKRYMRHETNCHINRMPRLDNKPFKCTCGFNKMVERLKSGK